MNSINYNNNNIAKNTQARSEELIRVLQSITSLPGAHTSGTAHCIREVNNYKHLIQSSDDFVALIQKFSPNSTFQIKEIPTGTLVIAFQANDVIGSFNKKDGIMALAG